MSLAAAIHHRLWSRRPRALGRIPGPRPTLPLGNAGAFLRNPRPWEVCCRLHGEYGDYALLWLFHRPAVLLHDPDLIGEVLERSWPDFPKAEPCRAMRPGVTASSPFIANGADWERKRRASPLLQPGAAGRIESEWPALARVLEEQLRRRLGGPRRRADLAPDLLRVAFDGFSHLILGELLGDADYRSFSAVMRLVDARMKTNAPLWTPGFVRHRRRWWRCFTERLGREGGGGLLGALQRGATIDRRSFALEMANVFPGGLFSVTSTWTNALALLALHPPVREELRGELDALAAPSEAGLADPARLPLLEGVLRETMRLYPAAPVTSRAVRSERPLGAHVLPRGTRILISNLPLHTDPAVWRRPREFAPERWDAATLARHPFGSAHFFPFGRGPRVCLGQDLALPFLRVALATAVTRFGLDVDPASALGQRYFFGCMMPVGIRGRLSERAARAG